MRINEHQTLIGPQIPSPKMRQNNKQPPPQASPTAQQKFLYQTVGSQSGQVSLFQLLPVKPNSFTASSPASISGSHSAPHEFPTARWYYANQ